MVNSSNVATGGNLQSKIAPISGIIFLVLGFMSLFGSWAMTDPTVEKINMVAGALVFFGLFLVTLHVGIQSNLRQLKSQVDSLLERSDEPGGK